MIVGAAIGFAAAYESNSPFIGVWQALCGMAIAAVFAFLVIGLATNQVAAGLALTILGVGLAKLGAGFVGLKRASAGQVHVPGLCDLPIVGKLVFGEDLFVYFGLLSWLRLPGCCRAPARG